MRHELISKDPVFQSIIPQIIEKTKVALTKVSIFNSEKHSKLVKMEREVRFKK